MKISVNCPSYKRPKVETLDYLPYCNVWVGEEEYDAYIEANKGFEENIIKMPRGVQGNISRVRNYIIEQGLKDNDAILVVDDDLKGIYRYENNGAYGYENRLITAEELPLILEKYTTICQDLGYKLWGVNVNKDALSYRQTNPFSTLAMVLAPFSVHLKGTEIRYDERIPLKEDYDFAIQHINKYRGVLRVNAYHYDCKQSKQAGGCATYRNFEREKEQLLLLQKKWGDKIVRLDSGINPKARNSGKVRKTIDYNPIIKIPIRGV